MKLVVLGSSSSGNCYVLDAGNEALILEAGIRLNEVKKVLGFNIRKVVGCLITHQHGDHAKYIKGMIDMGFPTLALPEVWTAKETADTNTAIKTDIPAENPIMLQKMALRCNRPWQRL